MISKRTILLLMAVWVFASIYWKEYKKEQKMIATPTLNNVALSTINGTDPIRISDKYSTEVVGKIYEGLYAYHYLKRPFQLVTNLAEEMPSISPDGLVYTFKIKQGVVFQDDPCFPDGKGRVLKAADFVFSLKRLADPKNIVPYLGLIKGKIKGLDAWKQQADYAQEVEGLKVLDDYTLQVTLTEPWADFVHFLAMPAAFVVAKEAVIHYGPEFLNHPVGTGPFTLEGGFNPQANQLTFVKNPSFREKFFPAEGDTLYQPMIVAYAGRKLPLVDKVVTDVIIAEQPLTLKLENKKLDVAPISSSSIALSMIENNALLPKWGKKGLVLVQSSSVITQFFGFNHSHTVFQNPDLRRAMSMAFDRETYNQTFYKGAAQLAHSLLPPTLMDEANALQVSYGYNLERAKEYLVKAGYPGGKGLPVITLDAIAGTNYKDQAQFFAKCMAHIGIEVQVVTNLPAEHWNKITKGATMMHLLRWQADCPEPSSFLQVIRNKELCGLFYENARFNTLFHKAMATTDDGERKALYLELAKIATEEVPMICALHVPEQYLHYNWVKNVAFSDFCPSLDAYIAVDMAAKVKAIK
ncbi:ABC transporter substrate-binding protein [Cardinium endosymbiont of Oedothorax gibbosus]|uniref:ABC transporter substrate-binding protein n=1 Tax=Cardinium endosymbiont of Oedothorax gibbosus TaxID=931101 RepID=UPI002024EABE|nr:ABC transporter substrate-binding protein [Cardinium endosymbiont of Oedothorax gibbosus]CAH2559944.1 Peptide/nickel binding protein, MppA-type family protein [Cardinium endosymbiont of Oedothorax gibbosus]